MSSFIKLVSSDTFLLELSKIFKFIVSISLILPFSFIVILLGLSLNSISPLALIITLFLFTFIDDFSLYNIVSASYSFLLIFIVESSSINSSANSILISFS